MPLGEHAHECDLFLLSSYQSHFANKALGSFALRGKENINGWGIAGYDNNGEANILRSADPAYDYTERNLSGEFTIACRAVNSPIILGHLRLTSRGSDSVDNNHPFKLNFLGNDWTFMHNGTGLYPDSLVEPGERLLIRSNNDSARVFEFLRKEIIDYYHSSHKKSIIEGCRKAFTKLLAKDGGTFNVVLSNGYLSFVFIHHRIFYLLRRKKEHGQVALITTIANLTAGEEWIQIDKLTNKKAKMLVFSGPLLIFNGDIPK